MATYSQPNVIEVGEAGYCGAPKLINWTTNTDTNGSIGKNGLEFSNSNSYNYATAKANVTVYKGRFYYEVKVASSGDGRVGWCTEKYAPENRYASIGNDEMSWSFDGSHRTKNHNDKSGKSESYGENWSSGDIIGSLVDFDQRRIIYFRNGKSLGVCFTNIRNDTGLIPAVSVYRGTKFELNFGRDFKHQPPGSFGLNPIMTPSQAKEVEKIFNKYRDKEVSLSRSGNSRLDDIAPAGVMSLASDLGSTGPFDPLVVIVAWKLRSAALWNFHKGEWTCMWALAGFDAMKTCVKTWKEELSKEDLFRNFYCFVFDYLKGDRAATAMAKDEAIPAWKMMGIDTKWPLFPKWEAYWKQNTTKAVSRDTWVMLLPFIEKHGKDVDNYDDTDCWPIAIDEFVTEYLKKGR